MATEKLSKNEVSALRMFAGGMMNQEIAFALDISDEEFDQLTKSVFLKLEVLNKASAIKTAIKRNLIDTKPF